MSKKAFFFPSQYSFTRFILLDLSQEGTLLASTLFEWMNSFRELRFSYLPDEWIDWLLEIKWQQVWCYNSLYLSSSSLTISYEIMNLSFLTNNISNMSSVKKKKNAMIILNELFILPLYSINGIFCARFCLHKHVHTHVHMRENIQLSGFPPFFFFFFVDFMKKFHYFFFCCLLNIKLFFLRF